MKAVETQLTTGPGADEGASALHPERLRLTDQARRLSRMIGQAKRNGGDVETLVIERRNIEASLAALAASATAPPPSSSAGARAGSPQLVAPDTFAPSPAQRQCQVRLFKPEDAETWDAFVHGHQDASVYHLSGWRAVCELSFGHRCPYLLAESNGALVGVLPLVHLESRLLGNFLVSLPYFNYGGVLSQDETVKSALLEKASALAREAGCGHMELRDTRPLPGWPARTDKVAMWLTLPDNSDALWKQLGSKLRAQVKKSQEAKLTWSTGGIDLLDDFYKVFAIHMRDLGTPVYSKAFFANILRLAPGKPVIVVGHDRQGTPVSVAFLLQFGDRMEVPWASTLRRANRSNANMALYWHMLQLACQRGCHVFDFGRSSRDANTYRFKKQWGAQPVDLYWHYWLADGVEPPRLNPDNPKYRLAIAAWKRMPVWMSILIGPPIVKNLP